MKELLGNKNHIVDYVLNGVSGVDKIMTTTYDVIIMDIVLPDIDGIELMTYLREKGNTTPILILSGKSKVTDIINGLDKGADDYLTKPFNPGELLARIRALYRRNNDRLKEEIISFSNLTLNISTVELCSQNKKEQLTHKEFELIRLFIKNPYHVFAKEDIISKIWPFDDLVNYNTLEAHICSLRKKLKHIGSDPNIVTIREMGYKLVV